MSIGNVGLGHVGLPLAVEFAEAGEPVEAAVRDNARGDCDPAIPVAAHPDVNHAEIARRTPFTLDLCVAARGVDAASVELL